MGVVYILNFAVISSIRHRSNSFNQFSLITFKSLIFVFSLVTKLFKRYLNMMLIVAFKFVIMVVPLHVIALFSSKKFLLDAQLIQTLVSLQYIGYIFMVEFLDTHVVAWLVFFVLQTLIS